MDPELIPRSGLVVTPQWLRNHTFRFTVTGAVPGQNYQIQRSSNLFDWTDLEQVTLTNGQFLFTDPAATSSTGFYRFRSGGA